MRKDRQKWFHLWLIPTFCLPLHASRAWEKLWESFWKYFRPTRSVQPAHSCCFIVIHDSLIVYFCTFEISTLRRWWRADSDAIGRVTSHRSESRGSRCSCWQPHHAFPTQRLWSGHWFRDAPTPFWGGGARSEDHCWRTRGGAAHGREWTTKQDYRDERKRNKSRK